MPIPYLTDKTKFQLKELEKAGKKFLIAKPQDERDHAASFQVAIHQANNGI
jgi:hypothetical protein